MPWCELQRCAVVMRAVGPLLVPRRALPTKAVAGRASPSLPGERLPSGLARYLVPLLNELLKPDQAGRMDIQVVGVQQLVSAHVWQVCGLTKRT